jgi:3-oxoacyl-[acyl-carrier protein] reductase
MLLEGKNAVIYDGGGSIGGAVARAVASEGASVFLAGRTIATLDEVAASDRASIITGTAINMTGGTVVD